MSGTDDAIEAALEVFSDYGCWRHQDGKFLVMCGFCKTWCEAEPVLETPPGMPIPSDVAIEYCVDPAQSTVQMHVSIRLHVHDHECPGGREILKAFAEEA